MRKILSLLLLPLLGILFIGYPTARAVFHQARSDATDALLKPENKISMEIETASDLLQNTASALADGHERLSLLDSAIAERSRQRARRHSELAAMRRVLRDRRDMLESRQPVYLIGSRQYDWNDLNRRTVQLADRYTAERDLLAEQDRELDALKADRARVAADIESAEHEQVSLEQQLVVLRARLDSMAARRAVVGLDADFDRSAFDRAKKTITRIKASITAKNRSMDFRSRGRTGPAAILPGETARDGARAVADALGDVPPPVVPAPSAPPSPKSTVAR